MSHSKNIGRDSASRLKSQRKNTPPITDLISGVLKGDKTALARGLTLIESNKKEDRTNANMLIEQCLAKRTQSKRIGITGVPGVGKSTFIEALGTLLTSKGIKLAVLAVDPSSTVSKGSILGDKTRMGKLAQDENAFIRPSPSGASLGGVAQRTREGIILCEAAGYEVILIETVGVGQSEIAVHSMVDFFLLLKLAGAGDELQGIKRGIMEMADAIVINKADGDNKKQAAIARSEFERALHLYPPKDNGWIPKVLSCSALQNEGIAEIWEMITAYFELGWQKGFIEKRRQEQNKNWFLQTVEGLLYTQFYQDPKFQDQLKNLLQRVDERSISPFKAAEELLKYHLDPS
ncbi:MAG: methylmalonyl Co-A mutase-associated GTPase MeaB [Flavobacteriaceae bacterium]